MFTKFQSENLTLVFQCILVYCSLLFTSYLNMIQQYQINYKTFIPLGISFIFIVILTIASLVLMIQNSGKQSEFATLTGINGFLVLILIGLLYWQKGIFLRLRVRGYAVVYEQLIEKINFLEYFYTFIAIIIMVLLVITQVYVSQGSSNYNFIHSARQNEFIVFFSIMILEILVFGAVSILIFIQVKKINELPPDSLSYSSILNIKQFKDQSAQEVVRQQNYAIQKSLQHMFDLYYNLQQLQQQEETCRQKNLNYGFVKTQQEVKQLKQEVYNLRDQIDKTESRVQSKQREEKRLRGEVAGLKREV